MRMELLFKIYNKVILAATLPVILAEYFRKDTGREYGIGFFTKLKLALKIVRNRKKIITSSHFLEHLVMATRILNIPKSLEGCVVECGSYKGGSTANLSLVCALCKRKLEVFDSFSGLPEPGQEDAVHTLVDRGECHNYEKGTWQGSLNEVKDSISRYGNIDVCNFHVGYFENTLLRFQTQCVFVFLDVDLRNSLETCIKLLWPLLVENGYLFTHEAHHREIAALFFDRQWWQENMQCVFPGLIGAGSGLGLIPAQGGFHSAIGYTIKNPDVEHFKEIAPRKE